MKEKGSLREEMRILLGKVSDLQMDETSEKICQHLCGRPELHSSVSTIAVFSARAGEVNLSSLHQLLPEKKILYPLCHPGGILTFHHVPCPAELTSGMLGILEPLPEQHAEVPVENIELFLCPGLAFGRDGSRLGHGGGFYDRALAKKNATATAVGIGMALQVLDLVPISQHDIRMDYLITELGLSKPK